jgi:hypothetical protein
MATYKAPRFMRIHRRAAATGAGKVLRRCSRTWRCASRARCTTWALPASRCMPTTTPRRPMCMPATRPWRWAPPGRRPTWTRAAARHCARHGCDAVHPGYGFLSERADFARPARRRACASSAPRPRNWRCSATRPRRARLAQRCGVPLMPGTQHAVTLEEAQAFFSRSRWSERASSSRPWRRRRARHARRASRPICPPPTTRCRREAQAAFGVAGVYVERLMPRTRATSRCRCWATARR